MDLQHVRDLVLDLGLDEDAALEGTKFQVAELPFVDGRWLGAFYPDKNLIVVSPEVDEAVVIHEIGHKICWAHFGDLSERGAEMFRKYIMGE
ncbi:unnamed protein product [marine sediment metagenome]|uniref:IrrE N-terminal-like domain-containing protein n=1 Tax=marine sediment metagenome TaxID=412755 RepID=X1P3Q2_9ZZZZ